MHQTSFVDFPTDVLAIITGFDDASHITITLWQCRNSLLNAKLAQGGCRRLKLEERHRDSKPCFPSLLGQLSHLEHLSIRHVTPLVDLEDNFVDTEFIESRLKSLNGGLLSLELDSDSLGSLLYRRPSKRLLFGHLSSVFPRLKRLVLQGLKFDLNCENLPQGLEVLHVAYSESLHLNTLPRTLTELKTMLTWEDEVPHDAPPELKVLEFVGDPVQLKLCEIPPSIVDIRGVGIISCVPMPKFPLHLTSMNIECPNIASGEFFSLLPHLTSLDVNQSSIDSGLVTAYDVMRTFLEGLPPFLKHLAVRGPKEFDATKFFKDSVQCPCSTSTSMPQTDRCTYLKPCSNDPNICFPSLTSLHIDFQADFDCPFFPI